jgi:multiple sugar transport system substrate-binding protein
MFAAPIGSGPMGLLYRKDLFDEHGIAVPTTWEELATAAAAVREIDPNAYLVNWDGSGNANWFAGLASQNGAQWFGYDGAANAWTVSVNGPESKAVAEYWQGLLSADTASSLATFSPEWSAALANGTLWTWPTAVWGVGVIKSAAPDTSGGWAVAPLPTWGPDKPGSGSWGGGGLAVSTDSEDPCWASQFALWMATDPEAMKIVNAAIGIYPTTNALLADPLFAEPDPFFGGQQVFDVFKDASADLAPFVWGPDMSNTYQAVMDGFSGSFSSGFATTLDQALDAAQDATAAAMERQGYTIAP